MRNRVASLSEIEEGTAEKNRIAGHSGVKPGMEGANSNLSNIRFFIKDQ